MNRLRVRIFVGVLAILAVMAGSIMAYSLRDMRSAMLSAEQRSVANVLQMAELAIHSQYLQFLSEKVDTVEQRKAAQRRVADLVVSTFSSLSDQARRAGTAQAAAEAGAVQWLSSFAPFSNEQIFVFDRSGRLISHPDPALVGQRLPAFAEAGQTRVDEIAWRDADVLSASFLTYEWRAANAGPAKHRYGCFVPFGPWGWMIGVTGDVEELQRQANDRRAELGDRLRGSLKGLQMAGDGFVFIFDGLDRSIVPPKIEQDLWTRPSVLADLRVMASDAMATSRLAPLQSASVTAPNAEAQVFRIGALDWYVAAVVSSTALAKPAQALIFSQGVVFAAGIVPAAMIAWFLALHVSRPLVELTQRAQALSETDFTRSPDDRAVLLPRGTDEIRRLANAFSVMERALYQNVQTVMQVTRERERIEGELSIAREIQLGLLPKRFPAFPDRPEIDIHAALISAKEVGGDLYDFYFVDERHLCFTIGDVAGKGVPAALFMSITKTLIKSAADRTADPAAMMAIVNDALAKDNPNSIFVTCLIGILDCRTGEIVYANGGHNPPLVLHGDGSVELLRPISGPALGVVEDVEYDLLTARLFFGETLLLYTDGVTEAMDALDEAYEEERLVALVGTSGQSQTTAAADMVARVMQDVQTHVGVTPQSDDITLFALRFQPSAEDSQ